MTASQHIDVIATTISGSIRDWGKVGQIVPLFQKHGEMDVTLFALDSHREARHKTCELVRGGSRIVISAGGSGTFNAVVEGCLDAGVGMGGIRLGFLRKGSADLIGKTLGMPDVIEPAIEVMVDAIRRDITVPCDILCATSEAAHAPSRHFVGYGGAEIFGGIPRFTENRFIKYYKGVFSQLLGDLGPFFVGMSLSTAATLLRQLRHGKRRWTIRVDDRPVADGRFQAMIIMNGDLGPDLPFAKGEPLGSGDFHLFVLRDCGAWKLFGQLKHAWDASIMNNPTRWGFEKFRVTKCLTLQIDGGGEFPLNTDGSTLLCQDSVCVTISGRIHLLARGQA